MRDVAYLSPSSLSLFYQNRKDFYLRYLADKKVPSYQSQAMSVGSAFDAYVKSALYKRVHGENDAYTFDALFTDSVEPHNRDFAKTAGKVCFDAYKKSGAYLDLLNMLLTSGLTSRFEFELRGAVTDPKYQGQLEHITLLGKPDLHLVNAQDARVTLDWKVNGYCSDSNTSPKPGYSMIRDGWEGKASRGSNQPHKDACVIMTKGVMLNVNTTLEKIDRDWADQLSIYSWLCGAPIGSDFIVAIDQLVSGPNGIRIAEIRVTVSREHQEGLVKRINYCWGLLQSGHIFDDRSREDSDLYCKSLEIVSDNQLDLNDSKDRWFIEETKGNSYQPQSAERESNEQRAMAEQSA